MKLNIGVFLVLVLAQGGLSCTTRPTLSKDLVEVHLSESGENVQLTYANISDKPIGILSLGPPLMEVFWVYQGGERMEYEGMNVCRFYDLENDLTQENFLALGPGERMDYYYPIEDFRMNFNLSDCPFIIKYPVGFLIVPNMEKYKPKPATKLKSYDGGFTIGLEIE